MQDSQTSIRLFAMDVDGTLTDGTFSYADDGSESKTFHAHDGLAVKVLPEVGVTTALISGRSSDAVRRRAAELRVAEVHLGVDDKAAVLREVAERLGIPLESAAFMGDDLSDIPPMRLAAWSAAPANAAHEVLEAATFVSRREGGHGAVRDAIEHMLKAQGSWDEVLTRFQVVGRAEATG